MQRKHSYSVANYLITIVVGIFFITVMIFGGTSIVSGQNGKSQNKETEKNIYERLAGKWVRPDGGYVLELSEIKKDGRLKASYFNPNPIKVFRAEWKRTDGKIAVFVELRDVNYPGSAYNLRYDPETDQLKGTYFQAVERQTYHIEFVRIK